MWWSDIEQYAIIRGAAREGIHLIKEVTERNGRVIDQRQIREGGQGEGPGTTIWGDEEVSSSSSTCLSRGVWNRVGR